MAQPTPITTILVPERYQCYSKLFSSWWDEQEHHGGCNERVSKRGNPKMFGEMYFSCARFSSSMY